MPRLIKNIIGEVIQDTSSTIKNMLEFKSNIGYDDYVRVYGFEGFIQDYRFVIKTESITNNKIFGMLSNNNKEVIEIDISYE